MVVTRLWVEQLVCVQDEISHLRIVHGALRRAFPGVIGFFVARERAHKVDFGEILKLDIGDVFELTSDNDVEELVAFRCLGHVLALRRLGRIEWAYGPVWIWETHPFDPG